MGGGVVVFLRNRARAVMRFTFACHSATIATVDDRKNHTYTRQKTIHTRRFLTNAGQSYTRFTHRPRRCKQSHLQLIRIEFKSSAIERIAIAIARLSKISRCSDAKNSSLFAVTETHFLFLNVIGVRIR